MGYTHYWSAIAPNAEIAADAEAIVKASDVSICGWDGSGEPLITAEAIGLNGDELLDEDFETFALAGPSWDFCKTGRRPYDAVVTAILISTLVHGVGSFSSDGTFEEWEDGINLFESAVRKLTDEEREALKERL